MTQTTLSAQSPTANEDVRLPRRVGRDDVEKVVRLVDERVVTLSLTVGNEGDVLPPYDAVAEQSSPSVPRKTGGADARR